MTLQTVQTPNGVLVVDVTIENLKIVKQAYATLPAKGDEGLVYDTDKGWVRWNPAINDYISVGQNPDPEDPNSGLATWGMIAGSLNAQSDLQTILTDINSKTATNTNLLSTQGQSIAALLARVQAVETAVLPASSSVPSVGVPTVTGSLVPSGAIVTAVSITGETLPAARQYVYQQGGAQIGVVTGSTNTGYTLPANFDTTKQLTVTVVAFNAAGPGTKTSAGYTVSAGGAVPVISGTPSLSGTPASGSQLQVVLPSATNSPTSWRVKIYRCSQIVQNTTQLAAPTYTPGDTEKGLEIVVGVVAINGAGESASEVFSTPIVISGGVPPDYYADGSIPPGIVNPPGQAAGVTLVGDDGLPGLGNVDPRLTTRQWYLGNSPISTALGQALATAGLGGSTLQYGVIARNSVGASAEARTPGYTLS